MTATAPPVAAPSPAGPVKPPPIDWSAVRVIMEKDLRAVRRSKAVLLPMLLVPVLLLVVVPLLINLAALARTNFDISDILTKVPGGLADPILRLPSKEQLIVLISCYLLAPLFLIVPMMVSAVLAADTFAGEKDRRTLETLLHLPVGDRELMIGKILASLVPSLLVSWLGFGAYVIVVNGVGWTATHRMIIPTWHWMIVIFWVGPGVAVVGLGVMVRVSARARSSQEANQLGGAVVLPLIFLAVGQSTGLLLVSIPVALLVGLFIWLVGLLVLVRGARRFSRNALAAKI